LEHLSVFSSGKYNIGRMQFEVCFWFLDAVKQSETGNKWEGLSTFIQLKRTPRFGIKG
jgi:hypothetical protein